MVRIRHDMASVSAPYVCYFDEYTEEDTPFVEARTALNNNGSYRMETVLLGTMTKWMWLWDYRTTCYWTLLC